MRKVWRPQGEDFKPALARGTNPGLKELSEADRLKRIERGLPLTRHPEKKNEQ